jgi:predicted rRNA methylase YqxC with S4 and FtsJ domains
MPEGQKDSALRQIKNRAPHIHQLVKSQLETMRQQAGNQGVAMAQQAAQSQQSPVAM